MRFNVAGIVGGANKIRHAVKGIYGVLNPKQKTQKQPNAPAAPKAPKQPKVAAPRVISPKKLTAGVRAKQQKFKGSLRRQVAAKPQVGGNGKPLNKQQRTQGAAAKMAAWKQKRKVSP